MESLEKSKKLRSVARSLTTKLITKIENSLNEEISESVISNLREYLEQLTVKAELLKGYDVQIEQLINKEDELEAEIISAQEYQEKIITNKCKIKETLRKNGIKHEHNSENTSYQTNQTKINCKLPKLTINKYFGEPNNWLNFWNQYESSIHKNESLNAIDKFCYLKSLCGGLALNAISGLALTEDNYFSAINILKSRFGRSDLIINAHMLKLINIEGVKNSSNISALRKMYDEIEINIRSLDTLNVVSGSYSTLLHPILMKLLPDDLALEFNRKQISKSEFNVKELLEFLKVEIQCRENICLLNNKKVNHVTDSQNAYKYKNVISSKYPNENSKRRNQCATTLTTSVRSTNCVFCESKEHLPENCLLSIEERKNALKKRGICFKCFRPRHLAKNCWRNTTCTLCTQNTHNTLLCEKQNTLPKSKNSQTNNEDSINNVNSTTVSTCSTNNINSSTSIFLQTCTAVVNSNIKNKLIRILIDGGSHRTFISERLANELKLPIVRIENLQIHAFGDENQISKREYKCVKVTLNNPNDQNIKKDVNALVVNKITEADIINIPDKWLKDKLKENSLKYTDDHNLPIDMLIGADCYWEIVTGKIHHLSKRLVAMETVFGSTLMGQANLNKNVNPNISVNKVLVEEKDDILSDIKAIWELDILGIKQNEHKINECEDEFVREFEKNIVYKDNRYETRLLWKLDPTNLDNNYEIAEHRLRGLNKRLKQNVWLFKNYAEILQDQLNKNVIEECKFKTTDKCYFLPHHPVIRDDKSTKVRIVYDASAKGKNQKSLNECLSTGPNLNPNILDIILKFRERKIAFTADIEKAFLQIGINSVDRDYLRFLYSENCKIDENLKCYRMTRVGFGIKCSPFILACVIKHHIKKFEETNYEAFQMLNTSLYVDDLCYGSETVQEAFNLSISAVNILKEASMNLRKFETNSKELREKWIENNISIGEEKGSNKLSKILGINWDTSTDKLGLDIQPLLLSLKNINNTKRSMLKCASKCFDPVGFISPFTIRVKGLLQELWTRGFDWDETFDDDIKQRWQEWCSEIKQLVDLSIPRYFFQNDILNDNVQLHIFCDASLKAYGAVAFFRYATKKNEIKASFIMSKSRITPLKRITLPRLELLGALIAARMGKYLQNLFHVQRVCYWTDSSITLFWIKGLPSRWKQFVCNRVSEIQELTRPEDWKHCDGKTNPADLLSRGCSAKELTEAKTWNEGPTWLIKDEVYWPKFKMKKEDAVEEVRNYEDGILVNTIDTEENLSIFSRFSSWNKLQRVIAWCLRFIKNTTSRNRKSGVLTTEELERSTELIIKNIQNTAFPSEIKILEAGKSLSPHSKIASLNPFLDERKLLRVGGRLANAEISENCKHPIILPKNNSITKLIINYYHERHLHGGVQLLLSAIRQRYWIVNAKSEIKKCIWKCIKCCKFKAKTASQIMADLPTSRVIPGRVFSKTGIDFAGPFLVKLRKGRGVRPVKCYVCVFVCMITKAVHLEIVSDMTSEAFLATLRRFTARRGIPHEVFTDCGTNFVGAEKILRKLTSTKLNPKLNNWILEEKIKWNFNPPGAPHHGGLWEATVKSMKQHLRKTIGKQILTYEEFLTLLCQIEASLNSRPLTPISNDPNDVSALTPGHFMIGTPLTAVPDQDMKNEKITTLRRWQLTQQMYQTFWKRWSTEYLSQLQQRFKWKVPKEDIKLNDLVIIKEENLAPLQWKLGRIIQLYPGIDGKVRIVKLKTVNGEIKRPITKLVVLPLNSNDELKN